LYGSVRSAEYLLRCTAMYLQYCCGAATILPRWCRELAAHLLISETD
jgi:hypothetical protein